MVPVPPVELKINRYLAAAFRFTTLSDKSTPAAILAAAVDTDPNEIETLGAYVATGRNLLTVARVPVVLFSATGAHTSMDMAMAFRWQVVRLAFSSWKRPYSPALRPTPGRDPAGKSWVVRTQSEQTG